MVSGHPSDPTLRDIEEAVRAYAADLEHPDESVNASVVSVEPLNGNGKLVVHGRLRRQAPGRIADQDVWWVCTLDDGAVTGLQAHNERPSG